MIENEEQILAELIPALKQGREIAVSPGDDCAVINVGLDKMLLLAVDQLIADVHYLDRNTSASEIAGKLLKRNLSDIAAMGGVPAQALLTIAADFTGVNTVNEQWLREFFQSLGEAAAHWQVSVCGGDLASIPSDRTVSTLSITGWVKPQQLCLRSTAKVGDHLYATGCFGNSFDSNHHLTFTPRIKEAQFLAGTFTRTMIDVSDGLLKDLTRIATASRVGVILETEKIPLRAGADQEHALVDGEDYELLLAVPPEMAPELDCKWPFAEVPITRIGRFTDQHPGEISALNAGDLSKINRSGYDHFRSRQT